ncbi:zinc finger CCCH-type/C3HC4-type RING finger family protein [Prunus dulcis]|uniref:Zinc finger CCCH-type/C3HC4-type RING finger family protein n=1 Tax=Prunus dulcis TaxID=3755 RepID=A0A5H2Y366_PRUDU|nr:zinc finger CCCH-type/C3HC4-type RING finger family protein [Prunus dulcis]
MDMTLFQQQQTPLVGNHHGRAHLGKPCSLTNGLGLLVDEDEEDDDSKSGGTSLPGQRKASKLDGKLYFSSGPAKSFTHDSSAIFEFKSSKEIQVEHDSRATATLETETDFSRDARAVRERVLKRAKEALKGKSKGTKNDKLYKGIHGYIDYKAGFQRELTVASEKVGGFHGPLRASAHIRATTRFDYQPDICKDYKETSYCGYRDSCKFMHDRGDYKSGWQMEREWDEAEEIRKRWVRMMWTRLTKMMRMMGMARCRLHVSFKHFLTSICFFHSQHHSKNKKRFVCEKPTLGIFNTAHEIRKRMAAKGK